MRRRLFSLLRTKFHEPVRFTQQDFIVT